MMNLKIGIPRTLTESLKFLELRILLRQGSFYLTDKFERVMYLSGSDTLVRWAGDLTAVLLSVRVQLRSFVFFGGQTLLNIAPALQRFFFFSKIFSSF